MSIFNRFGGEFVDIIEWISVDHESMVYRFPRYRNEIKYGAKLTVREGQKAILVNEGKTADVFSPGIYELKTANLPILSTLQNWHHGFESPFKAEVYFFNTTDFLDLKWGTKQAITLPDREFGIVRLRAFGSYTLHIADPEILLRKLVGTDGNFEINEVCDQLATDITVKFPAILASSGCSILTLPQYYTQLAQTLKTQILGECESYGLTIDKLYIENISLPENVQEVVDEKTGLNIIGEDLNQYTQLQAAKGMANAGESNSMAASGVGMAMGMQMGQQISQSMQARQGGSNNGVNNSVTNNNTPPPLPKIYYLMLAGERQGPMTIGDIFEHLKSGAADQLTMVWRKGLSEWQSLQDIDEIDLSDIPPPLPSKPRR